MEMSIGAPERHHSETAPFLEDAQKVTKLCTQQITKRNFERKVFLHESYSMCCLPQRAFGGNISDDAQLEDRVGARKYYAQRGADSNAFRR